MTIISVTDQLEAALETIKADEAKAAAEGLDEKEQEVTLKIDVDGDKTDEDEDEDKDDEDKDSDKDDEDKDSDDDKDDDGEDSHMAHHKSLEKRVDRLEDAWAEFMKTVMKQSGDDEEEITETKAMRIQLSGDSEKVQEAVKAVDWSAKVVLGENLELTVLVPSDNVVATKIAALENLMGFIGDSEWTDLEEAELVLVNDDGDVIDAMYVSPEMIGALAQVSSEAPDVVVEPEEIVAEPVTAEVEVTGMDEDPEMVVDIEAALNNDDADDAESEEDDDFVALDVEVEDDDFVDVEVEENDVMETTESYSVRNKKSKAPVGKVHKTEDEAKKYLDGLENKDELEVVSKETLDKDFKKDETVETEDEAHKPELDEGVAAILAYGDDTNPVYKDMLMKILGKDVEAAASKLDNLGHK